MLTFQSIEYSCKWVNVGDNVYLVASEKLEEKLMSEDGSDYTSENARHLDEMVYFYVPESVLLREDDLLREYVERFVC